MKDIAVYRIRNTISGDFYIGSSIDIQERFRRHKRDLRNSKHHSIILQRAYNKYGEEAFIYEVLEKCTREEIIDRENFYLEALRPVYNICPTAQSLLGRKLSEEHKEKLRRFAIDNNIKPPRSTYESKMKPVQMLHKEGMEVLASFESIGRACVHLGKELYFSSAISSVCSGRRNSAFGYKWKFS